MAGTGLGLNFSIGGRSLNDARTRKNGAREGLAVFTRRPSQDRSWRSLGRPSPPSPWPRRHGSPASAQGLFDFFFGSALPRALRRPPMPIRPATVRPGCPEHRSATGGIGHLLRAHVRRPLLRAPARDRCGAAQLCSSFCPAARPRCITAATSTTRAPATARVTSSLPSAFVYRDKIVDGCSCNGKDAFGLATLGVENDPTLRTGDIVATTRASRPTTAVGANADFTPIDHAACESESSRTPRSSGRGHATPPPAATAKATPGNDLGGQEAVQVVRYAPTDQSPDRDHLLGDRSEAVSPGDSIPNSWTSRGTP